MIIPNQKKIVAALLAGQSPDPELGKAGKQRSVHNNYLTLPVIVLMISNHYPLLFATRYNWLIVAIGGAAVIRHSSTTARRTQITVVGMGCAGAHDRDRHAVRSRSRDIKTDRFAPPTFATIEEIVYRDVACVTARAIVTAPKAILLDDPGHIRRNARLIGRNAAWSNAMPPAT